MNSTKHLLLTILVAGIINNSAFGTTDTLTSPSVDMNSDMFVQTAESILATTDTAMPVVGNIPADSPVMAIAKSLGMDQGGRPILPNLADYENYLNSKHTSEKRIGLQEVIIRTVIKNLNIRLKDVANRIAHDQIHVAEGIFDLQISGKIEANGTETPVPVDTGNPSAVGMQSVSRSKQTLAQGGLSQLLPTGGTIQLLLSDTNNYLNQTGYYNPYYQATGGVQITHPLLKNAGPFVTQANIVIAQYSNWQSVSTFRGQVITEVSNALQDYYELIFAISNVDVLRVSLAQAEELLRVNTEKFKAGVMPELDVLQAEADVASRQQLVISALQAIESMSDILKNELAEICEMKDVALRPIDMPEVPAYEIHEDKYINEAMRRRPDIELASLEIQKQDINRRVAYNQTLPQVDVYASANPVGLDRTRSDAYHNLGDYSNSAWKAGIQFNYPLQNRSARYQFHQAEKQVDTAMLTLQQLRDNVVYQVRDSIRNVETNRQQIEVGKATVQFNMAKVDTGQKRQAVGLATSFDVLAFQRDLANARIALVRSMIDYNKSIIQLEASKATLLDKLNIKVECGERSVPKNVPKKPFAASE